MDPAIALAFTAGMVATVNPCGFAMLPAYLSFFLGIGSGDDQPAEAGLARALVVGAAVSAGFMALFATGWAILELTTVNVEEFSPWLTVVIGAALAVGGVAFIAGWEPKLGIPRLEKGGRTQGLGSMFLFGVSYAVASLSCTLGPFLSVVAATFDRTRVQGLLAFVAYGLGMALLLMALTVTLALARRGLLAKLRQVLPYVSRVSGVIMALMGLYLVWYGIYEIRLVTFGDQDAAAGPVDQVTGWSSDISNWLTDLDPAVVALVLGIVVCAVVLVALLRTPKRDDSSAA